MIPNNLFIAITCATMGYLIGCINPAYIISRIKGFDIREEGSGNAGATNAGLVMGKNIGAMIAIFDVAKTCCAIWLATHMFSEFDLAAEVAGTSCALGHMFPFYMHFRGGKGLACFGGMILSFHPLALLILFFVELVPALLIGYGCVFPILTSILVPILYLIITGKKAGALIYSIASFAIFMKHRINIKRVITGEELPISLLWTGREDD